ncbi:hypothetical protein EV426DRAFT_126364 [Tirmania nivea]|nr:hypothetical protein EV426DRAFT_126364 [Tirmania nivea]
MLLAKDGKILKKNKRKIDIVLEKIKWIKEDPTALRNRLVTNINFLNSFLLDYQHTKMDEVITIQKASQLQFQQFQRTVQQHLLRPFDLCRQDAEASFASVASFAVQNVGSSHDAKSPWGNLCRALHDHGVRPEDLTDQLAARVAAMLQAGNSHSSCKSAVSTHNQYMITPSSPLLASGSPPSAPSPLSRTSTLLRTATIQINEIAISDGESTPHCSIPTSGSTIMHTATIQVDEFSVLNGNAESGASTSLESLSEAHTLMNTTSFQMNEFSISDPISISQTGPNLHPPNLARTATFKVSVTQRSVEFQNHSIIEEAGDHQNLTNGIMTLLDSNAEAHAPRRLEFNLSAKTLADQFTISESGGSALTLIVEDDHPGPMVAESPNVRSADVGHQRLNLDTTCIEKGQATTTVSLHNVDSGPLSLLSPTLQEVKCHAEGNTSDFDSPSQQQVVVNATVPDTSCNVKEPPPRDSDAELAVITLSRAVDIVTPVTNEEKPEVNPTQAHSKQSELTTTDAMDLAISMSGGRKDIPTDRVDITPFTYDLTLGKELHEAVKNNSIRAVKFLLKAGANANAAAPDLGNVLNVAVSSNSLEVAKLLLEHRADVRGTIQSHKRNNKTQFTALHCAVSGGYFEMVELLLNKLEKLGDINLAETTTRALQCALFRGTPQQRRIMQLLLGKHADVNARDSRGLTLLYRAISLDSSEAIKVLLEGGANISAQNRTALQQMLEDTDELQRFVVDVEEVREFFDKHGDDPFPRDSFGESAVAATPGLGKECKHKIHLSTESNIGTVRSESPSPSPLTDSTDNSTPKNLLTASKCTQNDPIFKFAAQCFIDILTQIQGQSQKRATVDEKPAETKFGIDTKGGSSTIEFECTIVTPVKNTSTSDSTATADPLPHFTGEAVSSSYSTGEATPAPPPPTTEATYKLETPTVQPKETESNFHARYLLKSSVSAADEKKEDSMPKTEQPLTYPLDVKTNELAARDETQFPICFQMSIMGVEGGFQDSYGEIDIEKIIHTNLVFLHNPEEDLRVGPWWEA